MQQGLYLGIAYPCPFTPYEFTRTMNGNDVTL